MLRFRDRVLRFRDLGASFSRFGCFVFDLGCFVFEFWVLRSSFSSALFSNLPSTGCTSSVDLVLTLAERTYPYLRLSFIL